MARWDAVVIGASTGGTRALCELLLNLNAQYVPPIMVVKHVGLGDDEAMQKWLAHRSRLPIHLVSDREPIEPNTIYIAPAGYHLLVDGGALRLNIDEPVAFARPAIDVLFETAAIEYERRLLAIILTGANNDGVNGVALVKRFGGETIAQCPDDSQISYMPKTVIESGCIDQVMTLKTLTAYLNDELAK